MDAADVLYGVTMGDDGVTKVVSRRLPREEAVEQEGPPPFAGVAVEAGAAGGEQSSEGPGDGLGEARGRRPAPGSVEAA
jgi:hypothetical protein